jgi:drug/metabolite transporter (DMT)-like permease
MGHAMAEPSQPGAVKPPSHNRMRPRSASWLAWTLWLPVAAGYLVAFVLDLLGGRQAVVLAVVDYWGGALPFLAFATVGVLILSRRPHNAIGWLCWAIGAVIGFGNVGAQVALRMAGDPVSRPVALVLLLGWAMFLVSLLGLLPLLVLVFPSGRLPSRRWRPAPWLVAGGLVLYLGLVVLQPGPLGDGLPANPLGVGWAERLMEPIGPVLFLLFGLFVILVLGSLVLRFRRARGQERQQLKWLTYAAALLVVFPPTLGLVLERIDLWVLGAVAFTLVVSMIPAAIGVAVLKYRLYEIDRVINRTLVYGLLTVLLGAVYVAGVFGLGQLLNPITGESALAVAASTLAVAALFQPARRRIQAVVDRRFNRRKYDAARSVEAFATRLRDQVDLNMLSAELLAVVDQTMQPTRASLWLRPSAKLPASGGGRGR